MIATADSAPTNSHNRLSTLSKFAALSTAWFISIIACRIGELTYNYLVHGTSGSLIFIAASSFLADIIYFLQSSFFLWVVPVNQAGTPDIRCALSGTDLGASGFDGLFYENICTARV